MGNVLLGDYENRFSLMKSRRILVLRPDNIGDVVLFSGALKHIRNLYKDAHITLAVKEHVINLVELCPYIDNCVAFEHLTWWGKLEQVEFSLKSRLKDVICKLNKFWNTICRPFHTIVYPVKSPQVSHLETIFYLNPKQTIGITGCTINAPGNRYPLEFQPQSLFTEKLDISANDPWVHEFNTTVDFLCFLGCHVSTIDDIKPEFWLSDSEKNHLKVVKKSGRKIIGLFPCASFYQKCWPVNKYGELTKLLGGEYVYAIFGSQADKGRTERVADSIRETCCGAKLVDLTGQTTLRELAVTIMCCDLLIGVDTSGLHMAIAADVPTIAVVGGGHFGRFVPWGSSDKHIFVTNKLECFHCGWVCSKQDIECINKVSVHEIADYAIKILKENNEAISS